MQDIPLNKRRVPSEDEALAAIGAFEAPGVRGDPRGPAQPSQHKMRMRSEYEPAPQWFTDLIEMGMSPLTIMKELFTGMSNQPSYGSFDMDKKVPRQNPYGE